MVEVHETSEFVSKDTRCVLGSCARKNGEKINDSQSIHPALSFSLSLTHGRSGTDPNLCASAQPSFVKAGPGRAGNRRRCRARKERHTGTHVEAQAAPSRARKGQSEADGSGTGEMMELCTAVAGREGEHDSVHGDFFCLLQSARRIRLAPPP